MALASDLKGFRAVAQASHRAVKAIGRGAVADTWLFMDKKRNRLVAVKLFQRPLAHALRDSTVREITVRRCCQKTLHNLRVHRHPTGRISLHVHSTWDVQCCGSQIAEWLPEIVLLLPGIARAITSGKVSSACAQHAECAVLPV